MTIESPVPHPKTPAGARRAPTTRILDFFSSVWVGVIFLTLLFVYCSIGSAMPQVRQHHLLEMTEFQWFHWWPFNVLIVLSCTALIVVTIRRIPFRLVNAGVWMIHTGIVILCLASYVYFGTKVEGDALVYRRHVRIDMPGLAKPHQLLALPNALARVNAGTDEWRFQVLSTNAAWPILSEPHQGEEAYAVNVRVTPPHGEPFVRQLLAGYPQYTEDILPGQGRAVKVTGKKLVDEDLELTLDYEPQEYFHVMQSWALYVRRVGERPWTQRPIKDLPRYNDRIGARDLIFSDPRFPVALRPIDIEVSPRAPGDALSNAGVRVTGYLRYAQTEQRWTGGGDRLNPVVKISFLSNQTVGQSYELAAFDPARRQAEGGIMQFVWLDEPSEGATMPRASHPILRIAVPDKDVSLDVRITPDVVGGNKGEFTPIEATELAYRIVSVQDDLKLPGSGQSVSVAMVEVRTPEGQFTRMVADPAQLTRDMNTADADPHAPDPHGTRELDPRIDMTYQPRTAPMLLTAYPGGLQFTYNGSDGQGFQRDVRPGDVVEVVPGLSLRVDALLSHAVLDRRPAVVPPPARRRDAGEMFAMIRLEVDTGQGIQRKWMRFNHNVLPDEQYAYSGRMAYTPRVFQLVDGSEVEVVFSRERRRLPSAIGLEDFALDTHIGGYSGQVSTIRNYVSRLRFRDGDHWTVPAGISVNAPTEYGGFWYFQSTWDKPPPGDPQGGMNYTGLGVGNRNGVFAQLIGCCISVTGMIFAFYIKPIIRRRRQAPRETGTMQVDRESAAAPTAESFAEPVEA